MTKTANRYAHPVDLELVTLVVDATTSGSHEGAYKGSVDFAVPLGTTVSAAGDGVVLRVRDDSNKYGDIPNFGPDVNYITIRHANNELSEYLHLAKDSALVHVGDRVKQRQPIAVTGMSGWLFAPHVHFMVYRENSEFQCLDVVFK